MVALIENVLVNVQLEAISIKLFADNDAGASGGVTINGNDLKATTLSGVYEFIMEKDKQTVCDAASS